MKSLVATFIRSVLVVVLTAGTAMAADLQPAEWRDYAARFISPEGRVIDTGNGGISHSEGQGYGMILAAAFDDRARFDHLWQWTRRELQVRPDALFGWKWEPGAGKVTDSNSASDGDILIAWALLRADRRWQVPAYRVAATRILASVRGSLIAPSPFGPMLLPGPEGFRHGATLVVNPSYWVFPAFADFAAADPDPVWTQLVRSGVELLRGARFGQWRLPTDWVELGARIRPANGFPPDFGFNAMRVPLYVVWADLGAEDPSLESDVLAPFRQFWTAAGSRGTIPATLNVVNGSRSGYGLSAGGRAIAALTLNGDKATGNLGAEAAPNELNDYYSATLALLSKVALNEGRSR
jgi:endoglucanase